jgi:hypothetical protein
MTLFNNNLLYHSNIMMDYYNQQAERGFAAWAVFVGRTVVFVRGKGKGA